MHLSMNSYFHVIFYSLKAIVGSSRHRGRVIILYQDKENDMFSSRIFKEVLLAKLRQSIMYMSHLFKDLINCHILYVNQNINGVALIRFSLYIKHFLSDKEISWSYYLRIDFVSVLVLLCQTYDTKVLNCEKEK